MKPSSPFDWVIVGLGNPGKKYARTRHNVGEEAVVELARRAGDTLKSGRDNALVAESRVGDTRAVLAFPITFMNESGRSVGALTRRYKIADPERLVVIHDELDLEPGIVRVKVGGGLAGHNGLRSVKQHTGTQDFVRIRIGVGKPPSKDGGARHVLTPIPKRERELLDDAIQRAADAVELVVGKGPAEAMNEVNTRR